MSTYLSHEKVSIKFQIFDYHWDWDVGSNLIIVIDEITRVTLKDVIVWCWSPGHFKINDTIDGRIWLHSTETSWFQLINFPGKIQTKAAKQILRLILF